MKKIKIAFFTPKMIIGGYETVLISTLKELSKYDNIKLLVYMQTPLEEPFYIRWFLEHPEIELNVLYPSAPKFRAIRKYANFFPLKNILKIIYSLYKKICRFRIFKIKKIDLFIDYKNFSCWKELKYVHSPKIAWCHGSIKYFNENKLSKHMDDYDYLVCISKSFMDDFSYQYQKYKNKITHIYNPIDIDDIRDKAAKAETFPGQYFMTASRLDPDKDIDTVLYAFNNFLEKTNKPDVHLVLVGDGKAIKHFQTIANKLPAAQKIHFVGKKPIPFGYMQKAMAHILSSNSEGLGMCLIESAAVGTFNISSDCKNGPREILLDGNAGALFTPGDDKALTNIMCDIWNHNIDVEGMIKNATNSLARFDAAVIAEQIIKLSDKIINSSRK